MVCVTGFHLIPPCADRCHKTVLKCLSWPSSFQITNKASVWLPAHHSILSWNFHFYCSYISISLGVYHIIGLKPDDKVYCSMPLYHSAGGNLCTGQAITSGITVVIKRKFSASQYFPDCVRHKCTVRSMKIVTLKCGRYCLLLFLAVCLAVQYCGYWHICIVCTSIMHSELHQFLHRHEGYVPQISTNTTHIVPRVFKF